MQMPPCSLMLHCAKGVRRALQHQETTHMVDLGKRFDAGRSKRVILGQEDVELEDVIFERLYARAGQVDVSISEVIRAQRTLPDGPVSSADQCRMSLSFCECVNTRRAASMVFECSL